MMERSVLTSRKAGCDADNSSALLFKKDLLLPDSRERFTEAHQSRHFPSERNHRGGRAGPGVEGVEPPTRAEPKAEQDSRAGMLYPRTEHDGADAR